MKVKIFSFIALLMLVSIASCTKEVERVPETETGTKPVENHWVEIKVISPPDKSVYAMDEPFAMKGLKVEGVKEDNTKGMIDISMDNITGFSSEKPNESVTVTVTVNGLKATFDVKVLPIRVTNGVLSYVEPDVTDLVLPDFVTTIGKNVFKLKNIDRVQLNEGVVAIEDRAFAWSKIREINFPKSLKTIEPVAFYKCENLEVIDLSNTSMTKIEQETFSYCSGVTSLKLPAGVTEIGDQAFIDFTNLKELTLPEGLLKLGNEAFRECGLTELRLPNSVCAMDQRAFYMSPNLQVVKVFGAAVSNDLPMEECTMEGSTFERCAELTHFEIPAGVKVAGQNTISGSLKLTSITISQTLQKIDFNAFAYSSLQTVIVKSDIPAIVGTRSGAWQAFPYNVVSIQVPAGCADKYKTAPGWMNYASKIVE